MILADEFRLTACCCRHFSFTQYRHPRAPSLDMRFDERQRHFLVLHSHCIDVLYHDLHRMEDKTMTRRRFSEHPADRSPPYITCKLNPEVDQQRTRSIRKGFLWAHPLEPGGQCRARLARLLQPFWPWRAQTSGFTSSCSLGKEILVVGRPDFGGVWPVQKCDAEGQSFWQPGCHK